MTAMLDIDQLRTFIAISETGSFTKAAEVVNKTQSAVSMQMKRLEERRRVRLFAELGSTMKLPRSGKGRLSLEVQELADHERPPMLRIPEYLERRRGHREGDGTNGGHEPG